MSKIKTSNEEQFIFLCTRLEIHGLAQKAIKKLLNSALDWNKITEISRQQEILPFMYDKLDNPTFHFIIPQDAFLRIKNYYYANLKRNLILEKEVFFLAELAYQESIDIIPFKGFALIQTLYPTPALRIMTDVDILIKEEDFKKIEDILTRSNYQKNVDEDIAGFTKKIPGHFNLLIEIHRALAPCRPYKMNLPYLWKRARHLTINNQKLLCLSEEDTFLSLTLHLRRHTRRLTLKFIVDIAELLNKYGGELDWTYISKTAKNNHIMTTVYLALYLAKELLGANIARGIIDEFRPSILKSSLISFSINRRHFFALKKWKRIFLRLLLFDRPIDFILYLWRVSFLERFLNKQFFSVAKESIMINSNEKIRK